ncbi:MAG: hypothetical protein AB8B65_07605 [Kordia sp.]|uniref:hypothetical protein n=1 Tax=Kordia sp. TaxID=1965332 RepID=UPI00385E4FC9
MKKKSLKSLKLNKVSISLFGGALPGTPSNQAGSPDKEHEWFTDGPERVCETFQSFCSFTTS